MLSFADAVDTIVDHAQPLSGVEMVPLEEALGRTLAEDLPARENIPIADNSAMDGYAVRHADLGDGAELRVVQVLGAERTSDAALQPGQAMKIMTGAPIPAGADTVVMVEHTRSEGERVRIDRVPAPGANVRPAGGDIGAGQVALRRGTPLKPAHVGLLASLGHERVPVVPRPRVGVLATGNELIAPGEPLAPGKVRNANSYTIMALAEQAGATVYDLGIARDDRQSLRRTLARGLEAHDVLITSGGVSMGDFDHIKHLVDELSLQVHVRSVNIKPGKPLVFGTRESTLFFGLPGNPVSTMVTFLQFVRPALLRRMHRDNLSLRTVRLPLAESYGKRDGKRHFLRGIVETTADGGQQVRLTGRQDSNVLRSMGLANALVVIGEEQEQVPAGTPVPVQLLEGDPLPRAADGAAG